MLFNVFPGYGQGGDYEDKALNVYQYFNTSCFSGYNDDEMVTNIFILKPILERLSVWCLTIAYRGLFRPMQSMYMYRSARSGAQDYFISFITKYIVWYFKMRIKVFSREYFSKMPFYAITQGIIVKNVFVSLGV